MNKTDETYLNLLKEVKKNGTLKENRTGVNTVSIFGTQMRFDLLEGFPLLTTKKIHTKSMVYELLWFLSGDTNVKYLQDNGVRIWNEWADENGDLGPVYGHQWTEFPNYVRVGGHMGNTDWIDEYCENKPINQIKWAQNRLRTNPECRRIIVTAWNPADLPKMALAPCHCLFQFCTECISLPDRYEMAQNLGHNIDYAWKNKEDAHIDLTNRGVPERYLSCQLYQRSADIFLGVPFNIGSYALLTHMMAQTTNMIAKEFIWTGGDTHLYVNHFSQAEEQMTREPKNSPTLKLNENKKDIFGFKYEDIVFENYNPHPPIKAEVAV